MKHHHHHHHHYPFNHHCNSTMTMRCTIEQPNFRLHDEDHASRRLLEERDRECTLEREGPRRVFAYDEERDAHKGTGLRAWKCSQRINLTLK